MERPMGIATEIIYSLQKDKKFLIVALFASLLANIVMVVTTFIKK